MNDVYIITFNIQQRTHWEGYPLARAIPAIYIPPTINVLKRQRFKTGLSGGPRYRMAGRDQTKPAIAGITASGYHTRHAS